MNYPTLISNFQCSALPGHLFQCLAVPTDLLCVIREHLTVQGAALPEGLEEQLSALAVLHLCPGVTDGLLCW